MLICIGDGMRDSLFNRIAHWQRIEKLPFTRPLVAPFITKLTQSITEENRMNLFRLRAARVENGHLFYTSLQ